MKRLRNLVPALFALVLVCAACQAPNLRNEKFLKDQSLTSNEPCAAPCWHNITPGKTAWSEALTILEDDNNYDDPQTQDAKDGPAKLATWQQKDGDACCQMVSEDGKTVSFILLQLAPRMTVGDLVKAKGQPKYAIGTPGNEDQAIVNLFYPDQSLIAIAFVAGADKGKLSESSEIIGAWYLTPERMDLILKTSNLYSWKGYEPFSTYKPDATDDSVFAITPSITLTPTPTGQ
jgi:hypothetical protein